MRKPVFIWGGDRSSAGISGHACAGIRSGLILRLVLMSGVMLKDELSQQFLCDAFYFIKRKWRLDSVPSVFNNVHQNQMPFI